METVGYCPVCDLNYVMPTDARAHSVRHKKCLAAIEKYGFFCGIDVREAMKAKASRIISDVNTDFQSKVDAMDMNLQAYFSRSLDGAKFSLRHPKFEEYAAMLLGDSALWLRTVPRDVYKAACAKYGTRPGLRPGSTYWVPHKGGDGCATTACQ